MRGRDREREVAAFKVNYKKFVWDNQKAKITRMGEWENEIDMQKEIDRLPIEC